MIFRILEDQFAQKSKRGESSRPAFYAACAGARPTRAGAHLANPAVGAVVVKDGIIVGRGWTQAAGGRMRSLRR